MFSTNNSHSLHHSSLRHMEQLLGCLPLFPARARLEKANQALVSSETTIEGAKPGLQLSLLLLLCSAATCAQARQKLLEEPDIGQTVSTETPIPRSAHLNAAAGIAHNQPTADSPVELEQLRKGLQSVAEELAEQSEYAGLYLKMVQAKLRFTLSRVAGMQQAVGLDEGCAESARCQLDARRQEAQKLMRVVDCLKALVAELG